MAERADEITLECFNLIAFERGEKNRFCTAPLQLSVLIQKFKKHARIFRKKIKDGRFHKLASGKDRRFARDCGGSGSIEARNLACESIRQL